jgi:shikimate kinase
MDGKNTWLIALAGTNGAGKDTVGELIAKEYDFLFFSVTELLREECIKRGISTARENTRMISAEWRKKYGLSVLVDKAIEHYKSMEKKYAGLVLSSIRNPGEADKIHEEGGLMVWLDADPKLRYDRLQSNRHTRADRAADDNKTLSQFLAEEEAEMHPTGDPTKLSTLEVKKLCDVFIDNDGDIELLKEKLSETLFS